MQYGHQVAFAVPVAFNTDTLSQNMLFELRWYGEQGILCSLHDSVITSVEMCNIDGQSTCLCLVMNNIVCIEEHTIIYGMRNDFPLLNEKQLAFIE